MHRDPRWAGPLVLVASLGCCVVGCARTTIPATTGVVVDPAPDVVTPHGDLEILRHRAAMGLVGEVRAELGSRLAGAATDLPDPGRDALRSLAIELALIQGDAVAAQRELTQLDHSLDGLGPRAEPELRARRAVLHGSLLYAQRRYDDARASHLRALSALEGQNTAPTIKGTAMRALARAQLAMGDAHAAMATLAVAIAVHRDDASAHIELHEDLILAVDVMLAVNETNEAVIIAGDAYNQALTRFGPDTLPHAEALLMVGAATLAGGDVIAASSVISDAREILDKLQAERSDPTLPVSVRALLRSAALVEALPTPAPASSI